jgi:hypothetical protein
MPLTGPIRLPLSWAYNPRSASSTRDPQRLNVMDEQANGATYTLKRPGMSFSSALGAGTAQGLTNYNNSFYAVIDDNFTSVVTNANTGTSGATFTAATTPPWGVREHFVGLSFKERLWVIGGQTYPDVWSTMDGIRWTQTNVSGASSRVSFPGVVFGNAMWIMGGFNTDVQLYTADIWTTENGADWTLANENQNGQAPWGGALGGGRGNMAVACSSSIMCLSGGIYSSDGTPGSAVAANDVWQSPSGVYWIQANGNCPWSPRYDHSMLYFDNKWWIFGGRNGGGAFFNDVWSSPDGVNWTEATPTAFASGRSGIAACVYNGKMWAIGGVDGSTYYDSVYSSSDGATWTLVSSAATPGHQGAVAVVYYSNLSVSPYRYPTIWLLGGITTGGTLTNDVYYGALDTALSVSVALSPSTAGQRYQFNSFQNGSRLLIKNQSNLWVYDSGGITVVDDDGYPSTTVPGLVVLGGAAYVMDPSGLIYESALDNPYSWPALNVLGADYEDDPGVALMKYLNYVVAFGTFTTQVFYDAGLATGSTLKPYLNANMKVGAAGANTIAAIGTTLAWIGQTREGTRQALMFSGLTPQPFSTPAIDKLLTAADPAVLSAFAFSASGHTFYILNGTNLPGSVALVYDFTTKNWYEWNTTSFAYFDFFAAADMASQSTYLLHPTNGNVYSAGAELYDDAGVAFDAKMQTAPVDGANKRIKFWGRLDVVGDQNPATLSIAYSDDDGQTFTAYRTVDMSTQRPALFRNGASRRRIFRVVQTDSNPMRLEALEQQFENGT